MSIVVEKVEHQIHRIMKSKDEIFNFKFYDNALVFSTDGYFLFVEDSEDRGIDLFEKQSILNLKKYFNDFEDEFLEPMKKVELLLGCEVYVSDFGNMNDESIRSLELDFIKCGKKSGTGMIK